jgi:K(+)-stimulated pyrophosphate-energized sodium pump
MSNFHLPPLVGVVGLVCAFILFLIVKKYPEGEDNIKKIGDQIHLGAMVFMKREYTYLIAFLAVIVLIVFLALGKDTAIAVIAGAVSSSIAGWAGMYAATKANVRTATAAATKGPAAALSVAFFGGSIMGLCVAALGLIGLGGLFVVFGLGVTTGEDLIHNVHALEGFGMGGSVVALFSRVGGGIFTKSADVGADLVGKIEAGIPEDDPRNPGVIADNVGDNVGDVAGMGSDIFESYCGAMIASIAIASTMVLTGDKATADGIRSSMMFLPLALASENHG